MSNILQVKIELSVVIKTKDLIEKAEKILLVTHRHPDADAIGSLTAMMAYLNKIAKDYTAFCYDQVPRELEYLSPSHNIVSDLDKIRQGEYDLIVSLDCGSLDYSGISEEIVELRQRGVRLVNIDHHLSAYGGINIVDTRASATAVILYELFKVWQVEIDRNMATSLLAGVLVDTGSYSNSGTTALAMEISADLIRRGASYGYISQRLYKNKTGRVLGFWSKVLSRVQKNDKLKVVYTVILKEELEGLGLDKAESVANFFNYVEGADLSMVLKELHNGMIKVSLRAIKDEIDAARIAKFFGGGGHKKAAGFMIKGRLEQSEHGWQVL